MLNFNYSFMVGFSYLEADEVFCFIWCYILNLKSTNWPQHMFVHTDISTPTSAHLHRSAKRKNRDRVKVCPSIILKTAHNLLVTLKGVNHILFFLINELNE